jgi:Xaa-Pro aminopeptidase
VAEKERPQNPSRSRINRLRLSFSKLGVDALLVTHLPNIQYLCGFSGSAGLLLVETSRATLFTDSRYTFQAREEVSGVHVQIARQGLLRALVDFFKARSGRKVLAFSAAQLTVAQKNTLAGSFGKSVRWKVAEGLVEGLRAVKDAEELARMKDAAVLISDVFTDTLPKIKVGVSEIHVAAEIEYRIKKMGASGPSFETIVAAGPRSAWAHAQPTSKQIAKSELVVLDHGAILRRYCSDMTRTVFVGKAPGKIRNAYHAVLEALETAKSEVRPGVQAGQVDAAARKVLKKYGLAQYFTHSTGHGLGIEVHEMPRVGKSDETVLQENMVITVEPGVYLEGVGGIRIEDDVVVTANGAVNLTTARRDFLEL